MLRRSFVLSALLTITLVAANGCQSCSSCHDYDSPVANCHCASQCGCNGGCSTCGCNSGGSSCGCGGGYSGCGCNSGCSSCNGGGNTMQPTESEVVMPQGNMQSTPQPSGSH